MTTLGEFCFALLAAAAIAALLGWASAVAYVIGLAPLLVGLGAGAGAAVAGLGLRGRVDRATVAAAGLAALAGLLVVHGFDDHHFRQRWTTDYAQAGYVAGGVPVDAALTDQDLPFYEEGAADELERQAVEATGQGGALGRWLLRAESGVRLIGPWASSRGLPVGRWGAFLWAVAELLLGLAMARLIVRRVGARQLQSRAEFD